MTHAGTPLAQEHVVVCASPDPRRISTYSPGICRLASGRLIATTDWGGPGVRDLDGDKVEYAEAQPCWQGRVYLSDDGGATWRLSGTWPFMHARPFAAGGRVYILGHAGDLRVTCSEDGGETWSATRALTAGQTWHQAPCNVHYAHGCVYLVMEQRVSTHIQAWPVGELAPVLMRARVDDDLTRPESWTMASRLSFAQAAAHCAAGLDAEDCAAGPPNAGYPGLDGHGIPFYACPYPRGGPADGVERRRCAPIGWLETNVVRFVDPDHRWTDPQGKTLHLWMRAHTGGTGYACVAKVVERGDRPGTGPMETTLERAPSGKAMLYVPCPGGQMKFHVLYDPVTRLYWLLSTQATDSMTRADRLPADRYGLPNNERRRLQLHFSRNMVDWCFAGLVAAGEAEQAARHYASMAIDGDDLVVLSRSGDARAKSAHDGNLITFHRIQEFRALVY